MFVFAYKITAIRINLVVTYDSTLNITDYKQKRAELNPSRAIALEAVPVSPNPASAGLGFELQGLGSDGKQHLRMINFAGCEPSFLITFWVHWLVPR